MPGSVVSLKDSITTQLFRRVFAFYLSIAIALTLIHMVAEYYNEEEQILADLKVFQGTFEQGLAQSIYDFTNTALKAQIIGISKVPIILGTKIVNEEGTMIAGVGEILNANGDKKVLEPSVDLELGISDKSMKTLSETPFFSRVIKHAFPIFYKDRLGEMHEVGTVTYYSNTSIVFQKVKNGFLFILVNSILKIRFSIDYFYNVLGGLQLLLNGL